MLLKTNVCIEIYKSNVQITVPIELSIFNYESMRTISSLAQKENNSKLLKIKL